VFGLTCERLGKPIQPLVEGHLIRPYAYPSDDVIDPGDGVVPVQLDSEVGLVEANDNGTHASPEAAPVGFHLFGQCLLEPLRKLRDHVRDVAPAPQEGGEGIELGVVGHISIVRVAWSPGCGRGQTSLPAELRHRWGIEGGGEVGVLAERYDAGLAAMEDPDLADQ